MRACSVSGQDSHIPLDRRTFLQWLSRWWRGQHESGSSSLSIRRGDSSGAGRLFKKVLAKFELLDRFVNNRSRMIPPQTLILTFARLAPSLTSTILSFRRLRADFHATSCAIRALVQ